MTVPRLATVYVEQIRGAAQECSLRPAETGANIVLVEPFDHVAFERGPTHDGLTYAACAQVAGDLLTGPGRSPVEGEAFMEWMAANESKWRT